MSKCAWHIPTGYPGLGDNCLQKIETGYICAGKPNLSDDIQLIKADLDGNVTSIADYEISNLQFRLNVYPNPFKHTTTISFNLNKTAITKIKIYNIKGQLIETLINDTKTAGNHLVVWNTNDYNSGLYLIQLIIDNKLNKVSKALIIRHYKILSETC